MADEPRTRGSTVTRLSPITSYRKNLQSGLVDRTYNSTYPETESIQMDDVVTENFHTRIKQGEIINNPMTKVTVSQTESSMLWDHGITNQYAYYGTWAMTKKSSFTCLSCAGDFQYEIDKAVAESFAKVTSNEATALVTLGELKETKKLLLSVASRSFYLVKKLKYWDYLRSRKVKLSKILDAWMEVRYAWRPLYGDMLNIKKALAVLDVRPPRQTFRGFEAIDTYKQDVTDVTFDSVYKVRYARYTKLTGFVSAGVLCNQRFNAVPDTWGLTKIPQAAWDLTKLSWMIDWVFDVSTYIASWVPDTFWHPLTNWATVRYVQTQTVTPGVCVYCPSDRWYNHHGGSYHVRTDYVQRIPRVDRPTIPMTQFNLDWAKAIDTVAVAKAFWNSFRKNRKSRD